MHRSSSSGRHLCLALLLSGSTSLGLAGCAQSIPSVSVSAPSSSGEAEVPRGKLLLRTGAPRAAADDSAVRRAAARESWRVVREQRVSLKRCYRESLRRSPERVVRMTLHLAADEQGRIVARRSDGQALGDAQGDACIQQILSSSTTIDPRLVDQPLAEVPLVFYVHPGRTDAPKRYRSGQRSYEEGYRRRTETASYNEASARAGQNHPGPWSPR